MFCNIVKRNNFEHVLIEGVVLVIIRLVPSSKIVRANLCDKLYPQKLDDRMVHSTRCSEGVGRVRGRVLTSIVHRI